MIIHKKALHSNPLVQFNVWLDEAKKSGLQLPEAFCLATVSPLGEPESRMLLLKGCDDRGFVFYTNFQSPKIVSIKKNPQVSLTFYWETLRRQVRVVGTCKELTGAEADVYFKSRPRESQLSAWASQQSSVLKNREQLEQNFQKFSEQFKDQEVPRPDYWKGMLVVPHKIEFWQEQSGRMHDRFLFVRFENGWQVNRLSP